MRRLRPPDKASILALPVFQGIAHNAVLVPQNEAALEAAWNALSQADYIGFDTESKPTFVAGEPPRGPDVVQFATDTHAFILQMRYEGSRDLARQVLRAPVVKTGFSVVQDQAALERLLGHCAKPLLDLDEVFRQQGYGSSTGIRAAVAVVFDRRFVKSKRVTTSNWSHARLEPRQLQYAADDAYVALKVLRALKLQRAELPIWDSGRPPPREVL